MNKEQPKLRDCPFCGSPAELTQNEPDDFWTSGSWSIGCTGPKCKAGFQQWKREDCIRDWNDEEQNFNWAHPCLTNVSLAIYRELDRLRDYKVDPFQERDENDEEIEDFLLEIIDIIHERAPGLPPKDGPG